MSKPVIVAEGAGVTGLSQVVAAAEGSLPGMCNGRTDPNLVVIAHANGKPSDVPRFILNVTTDATGLASGSLILGRGSSQIVVSDFCRVWQHQLGQLPRGDCESTYPDGAITAHAVGLTTMKGQTLLVRADVRKMPDGTNLFRVRYRIWTGEDVTAAAETDGCDESWTWIPAEDSWAPLNQMNVRVTS